MNTPAVAVIQSGSSLFDTPKTLDRMEALCETAAKDSVQQTSMRHIAYEGRTFVLSACQYLTRADAPQTYDSVQGNDPATVLIRGGSVIVGPLGDVLAGPIYGQEAVLCADINLSDCIGGKYDLDVAGHYARPDVFDLRVDETARPSVTFSP